MVTHTTYDYSSLATTDFSTGTVTLATDTKIVLKVNDLKITFLGNFSYDANDNPSGNLNSIRVLEYGSLVAKVTDITSDISALITPGGPVSDISGLFAGNDTLYGFDGTDELSGFDGDDVLQGYGGGDYLLGRKGDDTLYGGDGSDVLLGGIGNDRLSGNAQDDTLFGENGADKLLGGGGRDVLVGGKGNDTLLGGNGTDILYGGGGGFSYFTSSLDPDVNAGNDILRGGGGKDVFLFVAPEGGSHVIKDFTDGDDMLYLLGYNLGGARDLRSHATMVDGDTVLSFDGGSSITLENFHKSNLRAGDIFLGAVDDLFGAS